MLQVTLTPIARGRIQCSATKDGEPTVLESYSRDNVKAREALARKLGLSPQAFLKHSMEVQDAPYTFTHDDAAPPVSPPLTVCVRGKARPASEGCYETGDATDVIHAALVLQTDLPDPVVEWNDDRVACFLDVDYHHLDADSRPSAIRLSFMVARLQPQPVLWFRSRSGGLHALYTERDGIPANVLASVAGLCFKSLDPTALYDVIPRSRLATGEVLRLDPTGDLGGVKRFLAGNVEEHEIREYLQRLGLDRGRAYPHDVCPVDPTDDTTGTPLFVGDTAMVCKRCEAKGICYGSRQPGVFPYVALCGSPDLTEVGRMVENFTHWRHAEVVLEARCKLRGKHARLAYEGMLRLRHGDDPRIDRVFAVGDHLLRGVGRWVTVDRYESLKNIRNTLATLPAVLSRAGKPVPERLDLFDQTADLSRWGYPKIRPLHGMRLFGEFLSTDGGPISLVLPPSNLADIGREALRPRYVHHSRRLPLDQAWARIEAVFPNVSREYILLLLAARGVSEGEIGMPPNIVCSGKTGSGKSTTCHIAAAICGDNCTEVQWVSATDRFRQAYQKSATDGSFVVVNELVKEARNSRQSARNAFDSFLNLTPNSLSHEMYQGPVPLGRLPVTIVTDTHIPADVISDQQLARRFVYVRLEERHLDWEVKMVESGIGSAGNFRAFSQENADACNTIASYVVDRFFSDRPRPLIEMARELGFDTLEHCDEVIDDPDALPLFFEAVCQAPEMPENSRLKGPGWKRICYEDETPLAEAWRAICDDVKSFDGFRHSRKAQAEDWSLVDPRLPIGTRVDVSAHGRAIAVRFRYGEFRGSGGFVVNEKLLTCEGRRRGS